MSNGVRDIIRTNVGPESGLMFTSNVQHSPYSRSGWFATTNNVTEWWDITPENGSDNYVGTTANYRMFKRGDYYGFHDFITPVSALVPTGNPTYTRLCNAYGYDGISQITYNHVNQQLQILDAEIFLPEYLSATNQHRREHWDSLIGYASVAERNMNATAPHVYHAPIDNWCFFTYNTHNWLPALTLSHELRISVTYRTATQVVQTDTSANFSISNQVIRGVTYQPAMRILISHVTGKERVSYSTDHQQKGGVLPYIDFKRQPAFNITVGSSGIQNIRLTSIRGPVDELLVIFRRQADLQNDYQQRRDKTLTVRELSINGNGSDFFPARDDVFLRTRVAELYHSALPDASYVVYRISFSWAPEDPINCMGSVHFGNVGDPTLRVNIGANPGDSEVYDAVNGGLYDTLGQIVICDVFAREKNFHHQRAGDLTRVFT